MAAMAAVRRALFACLLLAAPAAAQDLLPAPELGPDGLWAAGWVHPTTGDLRADLAAAAGQGRILALFWERPGCEYCAELHLESLRQPELRAFVTGPFYAVRLQRFGGSEIVDFDGEAHTEREIAIRHRVLGTPTIEFRLADGTEVFRVPGAAGPAVLLAAFEYVTLGGYLHASFADWLEGRGLL
jgi:thioredoxin-related protein